MWLAKKKNVQLQVCYPAWGGGCLGESQQMENSNFWAGIPISSKMWISHCPNVTESFGNVDYQKMKKRSYNS